MKFLIFVLSLFTVVANSQQSIADVEACAAEVGATKENDRPLVPGNPEYECLRACIMKKKGEIKDGKVDPDVAFNQYKRTTRLPLQTLKEKINVCVEKANKETSDCHVAKVLVDCMADDMKRQK